jgi:hypothetical protein
MTSERASFAHLADRFEAHRAERANDSWKNEGVTQRISHEELERSLREAVDEDGVDRRLAEASARMSDDDRRRSDENLQLSIAEARASLAGDRSLVAGARATLRVRRSDV